jgi:hypothetical protein
MLQECPRGINRTADEARIPSKPQQAGMFRRWLKRRIQLAAIKGGREDLERFVESLRGLNGEEIGAIVATAAVIRMHLRQAGYLPDEVLQVTDSPEQSAVQLKISRLVRSFRADKNFIDATGAMVWLHTLRALSMPELRMSGRQMWEQLERGFAHSVHGVQEIEAITGRTSPLGALGACTFIPDGLNPAEIPKQP